MLVSEVMLQQTQAARVGPYYERFLARFPNERALAAAPTGDVLAPGAAWATTGARWRSSAPRGSSWGRDGRARWPVCASCRASGPYTAAAVASFAFGAQVAAVDTNARRVIERLDRRRRTPAALQRRAAALLPAGRAAAFNHAIMDLGATVCTARAPRCDACPLARPAAPAGGRWRRHARVRAASASRTPTATSAAGCWPRWYAAPNRGCPVSRRRGCGARWTGSSATA